MSRVRRDGTPPQPGAIFYDLSGAVGAVYDAFPDRELIRPLPAPYERFEIVPPEVARATASEISGKAYTERPARWVPVLNAAKAAERRKKVANA